MGLIRLTGGGVFPAPGDDALRLKHIRYFYKGKQAEFWLEYKNGSMDSGMIDVEELINIILNDESYTQLSCTLEKPNYISPKDDSEKANAHNIKIPWTVCENWGVYNDFAINMNNILSIFIGCSSSGGFYILAKGINQDNFRIIIANDAIMSCKGADGLCLVPVNKGDFDPVVLIDDGVSGFGCDLNILQFSHGCLDLEIPEITN